MKIGIVVYSQTGNTLSVVRKLEEKLRNAGHQVNVEQLVPVGEVYPRMDDVRFRSLPDVEAYEGVVFAAPVQGFALSSPMNAYLPQIRSLTGKKVACFVTQAFPAPWLGGNKAIAAMKRVCASKGAEPGETGIVNWMSGRRGKQIEDIVARFSGAF